MNGGVSSKELNEELLNILNELEQDISLLNNHGYIQHIIRLLQVGADPNLKNQAGKTSLDYLNEELREIVNWLAININLLDDVNYIQCITSFLHVGADSNVQNQDGKTLSYYSSERLRDVLNEANNSDLLGSVDKILEKPYESSNKI